MRSISARISLSGAVRPVAQTSARLKEAAKLGFGRAVAARIGPRRGWWRCRLSLTTVGGLTTLVAEIAARGTPGGIRAAIGAATEKPRRRRKMQHRPDSVAKTAKAA